MERFRFANLSLPPSWISIGNGEFTPERLEWIQPVDRWTAIYYQHGNAVGLDGAVFAVEPNTIVLFAPGVRATHTVLGEGTDHHFLTFNLPAEEGDRVAIPLVLPNMERIYPDMRRAAERVSDDRRPTIAFAWNLMWSVARNPAVVRGRKELYAAEDWIYKNLHRRFSVPEMAEAVGISARHLLNAFREEHRKSIQEFIRQKRVQEATRLLTTTDLPIKEIAAKVGIPDLQAFNKIIRADTGSSPRRFRQVTAAKG